MEKELKTAVEAGYSQYYVGKSALIDDVLCNEIDLCSPSELDIHIESIAYGLGNTVRFGGQITQFYSVAQHSILVMHLAPVELWVYALLHDAPEAYLGDMKKPLKNLLAPLYSPLERRFHEAICGCYGLDPDAPEWAAIKQYDRQAYEIEDRWLRKDEGRPEFLKAEWMLSAWSPKLAVERYLHYVHLLNIK